MVTRTEQRFAGAAAVVTAAALTTSLVLFEGGPPVDHGGAIAQWFADNASTVRWSALAWLVATMGLVAFAVTVREALWATVIDRNWATVLFVQGAAVFAAVAVVSAGVAWALAEQAASGRLDAAVAGTVWAVGRTLLRFASWGLTVPLVVVGLLLHRHSLLGEIGAVTGVCVAVGLLVPITWRASMFAFAAWLLLAGVTFAIPRARGSVHHPEFID